MRESPRQPGPHGAAEDGDGPLGAEWLDDGLDPMDLSDLEPARPRWGLVVAATVPWLVVAWLLMAGGDEPTVVPPPTSPGPAAEDPASATGEAEPSAEAPGDPPDGPGDTSGAAAGPAGQELDGGRVALAVVDPAMVAVGGAAEAAAADHVTAGGGAVIDTVVRGMDFPAPGAVAVHVEVTTAGADGATSREALGVGVLLDGTQVLASGEVWPLGTIDDPAPAEPSPVEDPDLAATALDALVAAGVDVAAVDGVARHAGWPVVVTWADADGTEHRAWLAEEATGALRLAGVVP